MRYKQNYQCKNNGDDNISVDLSKLRVHQTWTNIPINAIR